MRASATYSDYPPLRNGGLRAVSLPRKGGNRAVRATPTLGVGRPPLHPEGSKIGGATGGRICLPHRRVRGGPASGGLLPIPPPRMRGGGAGEGI
jgi:hypothetical protein